MPAKSKKQQALMAIAEHNPSAIQGKNKGVLEMSHEQLHDFAATPTKGLPKVVKKKVTTKVKHTPLTPAPVGPMPGASMGKGPGNAGPIAPPDQLAQISSLLGKGVGK